MRTTQSVGKLNDSYSSVITVINVYGQHDVLLNVNILKFGFCGSETQVKRNRGTGTESQSLSRHQQVNRTQFQNKTGCGYSVSV